MQVDVQQIKEMKKYFNIKFKVESKNNIANYAAALN